MTTWISIFVLPFALDSDEMSTGGDSSEAEASLNVHVALGCTRCCTRCCTNVHVSLESLLPLYSKYTLLPACFSSMQWKCTHFVTSRHILWIRKITKYTSDFYVVEMLHSVSKLSHNHQGSIDLWTANIHQNVGFYFLILLCQCTNKHYKINTYWFESNLVNVPPVFWRPVWASYFDVTWASSERTKIIITDQWWSAQN